MRANEWPVKNAIVTARNRPNDDLAADKKKTLEITLYKFRRTAAAQLAITLRNTAITIAQHSTAQHNYYYCSAQHSYLIAKYRKAQHNTAQLSLSHSTANLPLSHSTVQHGTAQHSTAIAIPHLSTGLI